MKKTTVSIQLDENLLTKVRELANKEGLSLSAFIRRLIIKNISEDK